jgi:hypothetical protein
MFLQGLDYVWDYNFVSKKCAFKSNYDLKTQNTTFSNRRQGCTFFKTQNFKGQPTILKA